MAAVRYRLGRGAYHFAYKICKRYYLEGRKKQIKSTIKSLSVGFPLGDSQNGDLHGGENAADRVTVGVSQDSYARATPLCAANDAGENGNVSEYHCDEYSLPNIQHIERTVPLYRSNGKFPRTSGTFRSARRQQSTGSRRDPQFVFIRVYSGSRSEPLYKTKTGYYEILGVTPTATQAQIKTSYYKQSFVYHPDRNTGEEATVRFSEISEAYAVLGNKALRRKYDRGLLSQSDLLATARPSAKATTGSSKHTESRRPAVGGDSRGGAIDFDKFFKDHYSEQLQREKDIRVRKEEMMRKREETIGDKKLGSMMELGVGAILVMAVAILISLG